MLLFVLGPLVWALGKAIDALEGPQKKRMPALAILGAALGTGASLNGNHERIKACLKNWSKRSASLRNQFEEAVREVQEEGEEPYVSWWESVGKGLSLMTQPC